MSYDRDLQEEIAKAPPETNIRAVVIWFLVMFGVPVAAIVAIALLFSRAV